MAKHAGSPPVYFISDRHIKAKQGRRFEVELIGIPTAGYRWRAQSCPLVKVVEESVIPAPNIGGSATFRFLLEATGAGRAELRFEYLQPWDPRIEKSATFDLAIEH